MLYGVKRRFYKISANLRIVAFDPIGKSLSLRSIYLLNENATFFKI